MTIKLTDQELMYTPSTVLSKISEAEEYLTSDLIASAPQMLKALKAVVDHFGGPQFMPIGFSQEVVDAINKAERK